MEHRIRAVALIVRDGTILMVKHRNPANGDVQRVPPGGGLEIGQSVYECAVRETYEETGLTVELGGIRYLKEYLRRAACGTILEVFIAAVAHWGEPTIANVRVWDTDADFIKEAGFISHWET